MRRFAIAGIAALAIAASTAVYAQHHRWFHEHMRMSPEDRAAFTDARIAAVKAGLKLNPDQEKLWPPVETAVRDFAKLRIDRARSIEMSKKPFGFRRLFRFPFQRVMPGKSTYLAGHRGVALLNDALLRRLSGPVSGRIAQLVEQMTLNHRVPGSSPGAPTIQSPQTTLSRVDAK